MRLQESIPIGGRILIDAAELTRINSANPTASFTEEDVAAKRLYAVESVLIDSTPTRNGNEYPTAWQESMLPKWTGTKLVYSEVDHEPNAPDEVGWIYSASLETSGSITRTVARIVIPVIQHTAPIVERLRVGLNHSVSICVDVEGACCKQCGLPVNLQTGRCESHPSAVRVMTGSGSPIHVALVADPGCAGAGIRATSESMRVLETLSAKVEEATALLVEDAKRIRGPVITEAVKFARLNKPEQDQQTLTTRLEKWSLAEIEMYRDAQREAYVRSHPDCCKQLANGADPADPQPAKTIREAMTGGTATKLATPPEHKDLTDILTQLRNKS